MKRQALILFLKYPERGEVKTRLASEIGEDLTLGLYDCFARDLLNRLGGCGGDIHLFVAQPDRLEDTGEWLDVSMPVFAQSGSNLGERMENAFQKMFDIHYDSVVIMGSDTVDFPEGTPELAFKLLETESSVIAPTVDGGYYLLGFQRSGFLPAVFHDIQWSTESVFQQTMEVFKREGVQPKVLQEWQDVDVFDDLQDLLERNNDLDNFFRNTFTMQYLMYHREEIFGDQN